MPAKTWASLVAEGDRETIRRTAEAGEKLRRERWASLVAAAGGFFGDVPHGLPAAPPACFRGDDRSFEVELWPPLPEAVPIVCRFARVDTGPGEQRWVPDGYGPCGLPFAVPVYRWEDGKATIGRYLLRSPRAEWRLCATLPEAAVAAREVSEMVAVQQAEGRRIAGGG
jgi:hypothetical protein